MAGRSTKLHLLKVRDSRLCRKQFEKLFSAMSTWPVLFLESLLNALIDNLLDARASPSTATADPPSSARSSLTFDCVAAATSPCFFMALDAEGDAS